jgi:hypothetical protein
MIWTMSQGGAMKMNLNQTKCGVITVTRSRQSITAEYQLLDGQLKTKLIAKKILGSLLPTTSNGTSRWKKQNQKRARCLVSFDEQPPKPQM